jgi:DNA modification methylase
MQFLQGDCLEVMPTLESKSIDCFVCDLPYGCLTGGGGKEKTRRRFLNGKDTGTEIKQTEGVIAGCAWDIKIDLVKFWEQVKRLAKNDHTPVLMFCTTKFGAELIASNPSWFRYDLVWSKTNGVGFLSANKQPLRSHEMIYVFSKKGAYYKRVDIEGDFQKSHSKGNQPFVSTNTYNGGLPLMNTPTIDNSTFRCVKSVVDIANKREKGNHPTQKPAELYEWLLRRYCPPEGCVLDPTAGSFTSCFVAQKLGLKAIGIEKDKGFYEKAMSN